MTGEEDLRVEAVEILKPPTSPVSSGAAEVSHFPLVQDRTLSGPPPPPLLAIGFLYTEN